MRAPRARRRDTTRRPRRGRRRRRPRRLGHRRAQEPGRSARRPPSRVADDRGGQAGHGLLYPVRDGAATRYLAEAEVARRYRERHASARADEDRADALLRATVDGLAVAGGNGHVRRPTVYLVVALVPTLPADGTVDGGSVQAARDLYSRWREAGPPGLADVGDPGVGTVARRRVVLSGLVHGTPGRPESVEHVAWHTDGAGTAATWLTYPVADVAGNDGRDVYADRNRLELAVLASLNCLAWRAVRAGASGAAVVAARVVLPETRGLAGSTAWVALLEATPVGPRVPPGSGRLADPPAAYLGAPLADLAVGGAPLVRAAADLAADLLSDFGVLPRVLRREGELSPLGEDRVALQRWADAVGVDTLAPGTARSPVR